MRILKRKENFVCIERMLSNRVRTHYFDCNKYCVTCKIHYLQRLRISSCVYIISAKDSAKDSGKGHLRNKSYLVFLSHNAWQTQWTKNHVNS